MRRFAERGLLYDPRKAGDGTPHRVDIGTSLGCHRQDREEQENIRPSNLLGRFSLISSREKIP